MKADEQYCRDALPRVSRTFALAIRVLPPGLRRSVRLAYLLCRVADTVEDDTSLDARSRIEALEALAGGIRALEGGRGAGVPGDLERRLRTLAAESLWRGVSAEMEASWELAGNVTRVLSGYLRLPPLERRVIADCVEEMALGMAGFVRMETGRVDPRATSGGGFPPLVGWLRDEEDLVRYADCVAGTVGRLLERLFRHHLGIEEGWRRRALERTAFPFSLGLQFTNIVQDVVADRQRGWCYVPESVLARHGLTPRDFLEPENRGPAVEATNEIIRQALVHLEGALEFTLLIPRTAPRIRLFCLWPLFLALGTLARAWANPVLLERKIKVTRREVRRIMRATSLRCFWEGAVRRLYARETGWARLARIT
jgi:farnesyl-diphosphate farnesyltransferase